MDIGTSQRRSRFESFFLTHYERVCHEVARRGFSDETAAECVQEAFFALYKCWNRLSDDDHRLAFVRTTARNRAIDRHRRETVARRALPLLVPSAPRQEIEATVGEVGHERILDQLTTSQRQVVELHVIGGYSTAETASALDIAESTVRFHLHRARKRARAGLARNGADDEH